ncbi:hypothetical protein Syun_023648 [Stephania yunnanensis]|uniref:Uncharacterized protein n=1 Tax=Stephania yunnanensis TaxID=152371 RepID=A0AAP0I2E0_9MAGN
MDRLSRSGSTRRERNGGVAGETAVELCRRVESGLYLDAEVISDLVSYCELAPPEDAQEYLNLFHLQKLQKGHWYSSRENLALVKLVDTDWPCSFCGALVLKEGSSYAGLDEAVVPLSDAEAAAEAFARRLVDYDRNSTARTTVIDDQSDYYEIEGNEWLSTEVVVNKDEAPEEHGPLIPLDEKETNQLNQILASKYNQYSLLPPMVRDPPRGDHKVKSLALALALVCAWRSLEECNMTVMIYASLSQQTQLSLNL